MKIAVIGAGLMGSGIAQVCAQGGYDVVNIDTAEQAIEKARRNIDTLLENKVKKGSISEKNKAEILINPKISALYFFNYLRIYYKIPFKYIQLLFNSYCANKSRTRNR